MEYDTRNRRRGGNRLILSAAIAALALVFVSCSNRYVTSFSWSSDSGKQLEFVQAGDFPRGKEGQFSQKSKTNAYELKKPLPVPQGRSLVVTAKLLSENLEVSIKVAQNPKKGEVSAIFAAPAGKGIFYIDIAGLEEIRRLGITVSRAAESSADDSNKAPDQNPVLAEIESVEFRPPFRGYELLDKGYRISDGISIRSGEGGSTRWSIKAPFANMKAGPEGTPSLNIRYSRNSSSDIVIDSPEKIRIKAESAKKSLVLPAEVFSGSPALASLNLVIPDELGVTAVYTEAIAPQKAQETDPGVLLLLPEIPAGLDQRHYRWDLLPGVIMFDFVDYATQDAYLKRLAFFVEKKGFAGRLASDQEIAPLHGWNAHDYKAEDIARFYTLAKKSEFPLNKEEIWLRDFLLETGMIKSRGQEYAGSSGALVSISRESPNYLRHLFLTHELSHAIFFADEKYRKLCVEMWETMPREERWFWQLYFGWMNYNTSSSYLMANEVQAYLIQQPVKKAEEYFSKTLVERLTETHPELVGPLAEYMEKYGSMFESRALELNAWLKREYGFGAGTTFFVR